MLCVRLKKRAHGPRSMRRGAAALAATLALSPAVASTPREARPRIEALRQLDAPLAVPVSEAFLEKIGTPFGVEFAPDYSINDHLYALFTIGGYPPAFVLRQHS